MDVRLLPSHRHWGTDMISRCDYLPKGCSQDLEKDRRRGAKAFKRFTSRRDKEIMSNLKSAKVNALRKGTSGAKGQEGASLKLSIAEGKFKALWISCETN